MQLLTYFFGMAILGCFFGSMLFNELSSGPKAINYLSFPASHLEKLACGLLYGVVFFFIAYTAIYYIVDFAMVNLGNSLAGDPRSLAAATDRPASVVNIFSRDPNNQSRPANEGPGLFATFMFVYVAVQSAYILGSVYFAKFSFIKTTIALACIALVITLFVGKVLSSMLPDHGFYSGLTSMRVFADDHFGNSKLVALPEWINDLLLFILKFAFAPILWVVTYFRFKEKQV
jgi:hypothetical protein